MLTSHSSFVDWETMFQDASWRRFSSAWFIFQSYYSLTIWDFFAHDKSVKNQNTNILCMSTTICPSICPSKVTTKYFNFCCFIVLLNSVFRIFVYCLRARINKCVFTQFIGAYGFLISICISLPYCLSSCVMLLCVLISFRLWLSCMGEQWMYGTFGHLSRRPDGITNSNYSSNFRYFEFLSYKTVIRTLWSQDFEIVEIKVNE